MKSKCGLLIGTFKTKDGREFTIRFVKFEDWPAYLKLMNSLVKEGAMIGMDKRLSRERAIEAIKKFVGDVEGGRMVTLVAELGGKIVGLCSIKKGKYRTKHVGSLFIGVMKEYRGLGIGKRLLLEAIKLAKRDLKLKIVTLGVMETNKVAIKLYKKLGFKIYGKLPKGVEYKGKLITLIFMYKYL